MGENAGKKLEMTSPVSGYPVNCECPFERKTHIEKKSKFKMFKMNIATLTNSNMPNRVGVFLFPVLDEKQSF